MGVMGPTPMLAFHVVGSLVLQLFFPSEQNFLGTQGLQMLFRSALLALASRPIGQRYSST